jgi:hypothetical protein
MAADRLRLKTTADQPPQRERGPIAIAAALGDQLTVNVVKEEEPLRCAVDAQPRERP